MNNYLIKLSKRLVLLSITGRVSVIDVLRYRCNSTNSRVLSGISPNLVAILSNWSHISRFHLRLVSTYNNEGNSNTMNILPTQYHLFKIFDSIIIFKITCHLIRSSRNPEACVDMFRFMPVASISNRFKSAHPRMAEISLDKSQYLQCIGIKMSLALIGWTRLKVENTWSEIFLPIHFFFKCKQRSTILAIQEILLFLICFSTK